MTSHPDIRRLLPTAICLPLLLAAAEKSPEAWYEAGQTLVEQNVVFHWIVQASPALSRIAEGLQSDGVLPVLPPSDCNQSLSGSVNSP
ncbi:MAG: hypothetical protein AAGJ52_10565 [Pseudomonadota bacterium]